MLVVGSRPNLSVTHTLPFTIIKIGSRWRIDGWSLFGEMFQKAPLRIINNKEAHLVCSSVAGPYSASYDQYISGLA